MAQIIDPDPYSNSYFFITGFSDIFGAGKNSFVINCTNKVIESELSVFAYDVNGNSLPVTSIKSIGSGTSNFGKTYVVNISSEIQNGIGKIEINGRGVNTGEYTGSIAFFGDQAYPITKNTRLPLIQAPPAAPFFIENVKWSRNILIDTSNSTTSEVRFFDLPSVHIEPQLYYFSNYPRALNRMASGSCSAIAITPKNNSNAEVDYSKTKPIYQLYANDNFTFKSSMAGEKIRIKNPYIKNFTFSSFSNNQIEFEGILNTDFIATIEKVINSKTLLVNIPFMTVGDLINRTNEDSIYSKNNLVKIFGYNINDDPARQTTYIKRNFYVLSISHADFEIFYKEFPDPLAISASSAIKSLINVEVSNLRTYCGNIDQYKIYGKSLNSPESKIVLCEGKVEADELLVSSNFRSGIYDSAGMFYSQAFLNNFWLKTSNDITFIQTSSVYINGAYISHSLNTNEVDYVIFKDDTTGNTRNSVYDSFSFDNKSYWYANSDAFLNSGIYPTSSYSEITNIAILSNYVSSIENLSTGSIHDSNSIKLRGLSLYEFKMNIRPDFSNSSTSVLKIYFSGSNGPNGNSGQRLIGKVDSDFNFGASDVFSSTFFMDVTAYGTIKIVPSEGGWHISELSLKPYKAVDYSIDSFAVKVPLKSEVSNQLYEIEVELYDGSKKLAYGNNSYTFYKNKMYVPLKKRIFIDPTGNAVTSGGPSGSIIDGGGA